MVMVCGAVTRGAVFTIEDDEGIGSLCCSIEDVRIRGFVGCPGDAD